MARPKYDKVTLRQLRIIEIERRLKVFKKLSAKYEKDFPFIKQELKELKAARKIQIKLNTRFLKALETKNKIVIVKEPEYSLWNFLTRRK